MGKRKEDQRRDDSSSSSLDTKRSRPRQYRNGPNDGTLTLIELKDAIQDKESTETKFNRKIAKLKEKRKKDKEDLRILKGHVGILMQNFRILKEGHEYLKSKIEEMRKEGCAEVDHNKTSPSQRSRLSQSTRFRLVIESSVSKTIYKNETVETKDGGGHIRIIMYDGGNPIAPDHPLASGKVDLVVIEGRFNDKRDSWSKEEFEKSIIAPREGMIRLVKNGSFHLIRGRCDHQGAIIMDNSQKKEVKLGVMIAVHREERVLEGVSNPFKVQEGKTKNSKKKGEKPSPVPTQNLVHPTQHGQGPLCPVCPDEQHGLPGPVIEDVLHKAEDNRLSYPPATVPLMVERNGQALNGNCQNLSPEIPAQILGQSISGYSMQYGQGYSWATPSTQNQQTAEYFPVNQPLLTRGQDQYTGLPGSSELLYHNPSNYALLNGIQSTFSPEDVRYLNAQTQMHDILDWSSRCGRVLLQWDNPHVELMLLYSTKSRFYGKSFPSTSLMDKTHKLLGSISSVGSVWKKLTTEPYDSDDEPPVKKQRKFKYQLRFFNRVCNDYYTRELIKSEDGTFLKIALYNENNLVVTSGVLSSASVEVVLLHGDFNAEGQDYWTSEEFSTSLVHPQSAEEPPAALGGDRVLALTDGEADLGNVNFLTSSFHARTGKFKLGVVIKNVREDNVQEGTTSPFAVRLRLGEDHIQTTISPPAFLDSSSCWNTNHNQLQQLASNNIAATTTTPAAAGGVGGGNNHPHPPCDEGSMATAAGGEGGGGRGEGYDDGGPNNPISMLERARLVPVLQPKSGLNCPRCNSTNTKFYYIFKVNEPRYLCRACSLYWTNGGALRKYGRHIKTATGAKAARAAHALSATSTTPSVEELADSDVN